MNFWVSGFLLSLVIFSNTFAQSEQVIKIGSKKFTENVILGEIVGQMIKRQGFEVRHFRELGGTRILWNALKKGDIDLYPEYTGTLRKEILYGQDSVESKALNDLLAPFHIRSSESLGFSNSYAIGIKKTLAAELEIQSISDLHYHLHLIMGFTNEFMDRQDGWPGLKKHYGLSHEDVRGLDHDLAYRGIESGFIQVIDMYSTDAEIEYYNLYLLQDNLNYFPKYDAVILYRANLDEKLIDEIEYLTNIISEAKMINMNARVKLDKIPETRVATEFLKSELGYNIRTLQSGLWSQLWRHSIDHLYLVLISLSAAIIIAIPLGIISVKFSSAGKIILACTGIIQTIPSLALLVFMIPLLGIGGPPAIVALFLYSLLPIVRNTYTGIRDIPDPIRESAQTLGLPGCMQLRIIELPMASSSILAGIKTSAVINVGTATLGALIGAGGYGQPILTGIRLDDIGLILQGAVPAALLALLVQWIFDIAEILLVPKGLRLADQTNKN